MDVYRTPDELYRKMIPSLAKHNRVIAPDYFGFGRSDKPTDQGFYTYDRHTWSITELARRLELLRVTLVVQDWGGPIGLRFAVERPGRVDRLVILNTGLFTAEKPASEGFMNWRHFAERVGLEMPIGFVVQSGLHTKLSDDVLAGYEAPFPVPESKTGPAMFPLIVPLQPDDPGAAEMLRVREALGNWRKPTLILFSDADPIFTPGAAHKMAQLIPSAREPEIVEYASHFLQEDKGEEIADRIARFVETSR